MVGVWLVDAPRNCTRRSPWDCRAWRPFWDEKDSLNSRHRVQLLYYSWGTSEPIGQDWCIHAGLRTDGVGRLGQKGRRGMICWLGWTKAFSYVLKLFRLEWWNQIWGCCQCRRLETRKRGGRNGLDAKPDPSAPPQFSITV